MSGFGFALHSSIYYLIGTVLWAIWFVALFLIALPQTETILMPRTSTLRTSAAVIFSVLVTIGLCEVAFISIFGPQFVKDSPNNQISHSVHEMIDSFQYNDATALCSKRLNTNRFFRVAIHLPLSNIITALEEFNGTSAVSLHLELAYWHRHSPIQPISSFSRFGTAQNRAIRLLDSNQMFHIPPEHSYCLLHSLPLASRISGSSI